MIKMMPFFNNSPFGTGKISKDCITGVKPPGKPSTSSESEPDTVSIESAVEETQSKDQMKTESQGQDSALGDSHAPSTEANGSCSHSSECRDSPKRKKGGIKEKLKDAFSNFRGGQKIANLTEKDGAVTDNKPLAVEQIREHLESDQFFNANQQLMALEWALYNNISDKSEEELSREQREVESLYELLKCKVFSIIKNSISLAPANPKLLRHAVYTIEEQEVADEKYKSEKPSDKIVSYRPRKWKEVWMDTVKQSVADRMKDIQRTSSAENLSTTALCFLHMGRTMKEDMITVVECIKQHYHAQFNVCSTYAECYHGYFSSQLQLIAEFELGDKDVYLLLTWVQNLYPNDIRKNSILVKELDEAKLGSLLPPKMIKQLEAKYLYNEAASVKNWLAKSLEMEVQRWTEEREPEKLDGHFHSELAIDVIQTIHGGQRRAAEITPELGKQLSIVLLVELSTFLKSYQKALEEFKEKNRPHSYFKAMIIANINNCMIFRDHTEKTTPSAQDSTRLKILGTLSEIENIGYDVLLQDLFLELKTIFRKFTQSKWLSGNETMDEIIQATSNHLSEFKTLRDPFYQGIMEKIHGHLVKEYIVRLMKKKVSLKTPELQQNLSNLISAHASHLQSFCKEKGSKATWLDSALPKLAEIIRLQDSNSIKIEVATLASTYSDISKKHLAAILYIKGNLPSSEVRSILNILDVSTNSTTSCESLFSAIKIS
ncbi:tumor necrosis factor alpha-induced protein 2 [Malaclemys terrapin pileata]|uniref:tumor necrosis factor alpha-induced protein 2 n=1 Tax=Malaclemys terrapin pileata TaxID=2991368 RepID=UPI0023A79977|nr:tumor necrosis factor alpha-induced protein 2 [Malaclemys terrapin pileata]XP_053882967.1 tumor necrosis factor alpha-induced protein 2 [Malaclemys terrapin pileata]